MGEEDDFDEIFPQIVFEDSSGQLYVKEDMNEIYIPNELETIINILHSSRFESGKNEVFKEFRFTKWLLNRNEIEQEFDLETLREKSKFLFVEFALIEFHSQDLLTPLRNLDINFFKSFIKKFVEIVVNEPNTSEEKVYNEIEYDINAYLDSPQSDYITYERVLYKYCGGSRNLFGAVLACFEELEIIFEDEDDLGEG